MFTNSISSDGAIPVPDLMWFSCDGMMVIDEHRVILAVNPAMERLTGRAAADLIGKSECGVLFSCRDLQGCSMEENPAHCPGLKAMHRFTPVRDAEFSIRNAQGKGVVVNASYTPIQLPDRPVWALAVFRDMTSRKKQELRWIQQAMTDPLTALPNRNVFLDLFQKELGRAMRHNRPLAVAMIDLDNFKGYNDAYGHAAGDDLLKTLAGLLRSGRRTSDLAARYGGDEFALLLPETDAAGAMVVADRFCSLVAGFPFAHPDTIQSQAAPRPVHLSIGVSVFPEGGQDSQALLACADRRMYEAKQRGGNNVVGPS